MLLYGGAVGQCYPLHPRLEHLFHEHIKALALLLGCTNACPM